MTSKLTRERLAEIAQFGFSSAITPANDFEIKELASLALAAMDSEPVGSISIDRLLQLLYQFDGANECAASIGDQEYALECGDVASALRELLSCRSALPVADVVAWSNPNEERKCDIRWRRHDVEPGSLYRHAQPVPVVPPEQHWEELCRQHPDMSIGDAIIRAAWWNHCRAAMLQAGNSPAQSDCCPAQNSVSPAQDGNSPATSDNWQVEAEKLAEMHGMSFVMFRHGEAPQCADPTKVVISFTDKGLGHDTLPAAPQEVIGE